MSKDFEIVYLKVAKGLSLQRTPGSCVGWQSDHIHTINEPLWSSFGTAPRKLPPNGAGTVRVSCQQCVHIYTVKFGDGAGHFARSTAWSFGCYAIFTK